MRWRWMVMVCLGVAGVAPNAFGHELDCIKEVNGTTFLEVDSFPTTLTYSLTVLNIHPSEPSDVLVASDPFLENLGWPGFDTPFTLGVGDSETDTFDVVVDDAEECARLAASDGTQDLTIENTFTVGWDTGSQVCTADVVCVPPEVEQGQRMTGGGSVFGTGQNRVTHGFQVRCDATDPRQNLEVNWQGNQFHLLDLTSATCSDDPALDEENPVAGFDTFVGTGTGRYNGVEGATIEFTFTDDGEPGSDDTADIVIRDENGDVVLDVSGDLNFGNHQAHP